MGDAYGAGIIEHLSRDELAMMAPQIDDSSTIPIDEENHHHHHTKENGNTVDIRL